MLSSAWAVHILQTDVNRLNEIFSSISWKIVEYFEKRGVELFTKYAKRSNIKVHNKRILYLKSKEFWESEAEFLSMFFL